MPDTKKREFNSPEAFRRSLELHIQRTARRLGQDLQRVRRKVGFERLLARLFSDSKGEWLLKGGYAMELRFPIARATRDVDLVISDPATILRQGDQVVHEALQEAISIDMEDYFGFAIEQSQVTLAGPKYGGTRFAVDVNVGGRQFDRFSLDVAIDVSPLHPIETLSIDGWLSSYGYPPVSYYLACAEQQFAEKLHAYTLPRVQGENSRVKDLVDLVLLVQSDRMNSKRSTDSIEHVFRQRGTHDLPNELPLPPTDWEAPFTSLATQCDLKLSMSEAVKHIQQYLSTLCNGQLRP